MKDWRPVVGAVLALVLAGLVYRAFRGGAAGPAASGSRAGSRTAAADKGVPRIGLDRLNAMPPGSAVGTRDIFDFGVPPATPTPPPTEPPALVAGPVVPVAPTPTPLPPLTLKYIGAVDNGQGVKVAVLMTDRKEVLTGQAGELVANRYRIMKIGLESVDIQEVGTDRVRRVPLRGN